MTTEKKVPTVHRTRARHRILQALYQWEMTHSDLHDIETFFHEDQDMRRVDIEYFKELLHEIPKNKSSLDSKIGPLLDRPIDQLDPIEINILRMAAYELIFRIDIPYRAVINEAVELAKAYGAEDSHKYINGVVDRIADRVELRVKEMGNRAPKKRQRLNQEVVVKRQKVKISQKSAEAKEKAREEKQARYEAKEELANKKF
ncbi:MAG: transcription antitermination factor NusB [Gammaproteobacteria bacterium]|nr:MAG: transcription antitermination factor NusB [Gammaproteobacteria bacterium]